jgi:hypothetical protein
MGNQSINEKIEKLRGWFTRSDSLRNAPQSNIPGYVLECLDYLEAENKKLREHLSPKVTEND